MVVTLSFDVEDGEAVFTLGIIDGFYQEALKEIELCKNENGEDALDDVKRWTDRANKYKEMIDELEEYIEEEANKVWYLVKTPPKAPTVSSPRGVTYTIFPCSNCGSTNTTGFGHRKRKRNGSVPVRECQACGKKYTNKDKAAFGMQFPNEVIEYAIKMVGDGQSLRDVAKAVHDTFGIKVSAQSVLNWSRRNRVPKSFKSTVPDMPKETPVVVPLPTVIPVPEVKPGSDVKVSRAIIPLVENDGFDYRSKHPKKVGKIEVYRSGTGKVVLRGKGGIVLTTEYDIEKIIEYDNTEFENSILNLHPDKRNVLREYRLGVS